MSITKTDAIVDPCVYCKNSTAFGSGRFVNRIGGSFTDEDENEVEGWMCAECAGYECDECGQGIGLDDELRVLDDDGNQYNYHEDCYETNLHGGEHECEDCGTRMDNGSRILIRKFDDDYLNLCESCFDAGDEYTIFSARVIQKPNWRV